MATGIIKASDLVVGMYLVSTPGDNAPTAPRSFTAPYPQVTKIDYSQYSDGRFAISYKLDISTFEDNMLGSDLITISTTSTDDGKTLETIPALRLSIGDLLAGNVVTDLKLVATTSDSTQHNFSLDDTVTIAR